ncbi:HSPB1-associated protein 1 [Stomoxys calcitrans]|uniref:HSPB1-associated protein 1 n=1 Tax=Stomoxys calcitrans TaxID=35570 RepID=UPI0027E25F14|nr:HSPB1-associated protein 1 [Stomoxys calcitrans]
MGSENITPFQLREIILNARKPLILKKFNCQWSCFKDGLSKWCAKYDSYSKEKPQFEKMPVKNELNEPQWERKRTMERMSAMEFLNLYSNNEDCSTWSGLNYKRRNELPVESTTGVDFGCFGFPNVNDECTFWLSSKGANTPCHYDTYGSNVVVQIFGRKSWLLFPPGTSGLTTTRIPYEESSVYCLENFYAPTAMDVIKLSKLSGQCYHYVLEPNDVLIVPRHWWHFVEALETSLSVNAWIPLSCDVDNQIEECIVKYFMDKMIANKDSTTRHYLMNPNQLNSNTSDDELFNILEYLLEQKNNVYEHAAKKTSSVHQYHYIDENNLISLIKSFGNICEVSLMADDDWEMYLKRNCTRCNSEKINEGAVATTLRNSEDILINSICSPYIVQTIKEEFCRRYIKNKTKE